MPAVHAERALAEQAATTGKSLAALVARAGAAPLTNVDHDAAARAIALDNIAVEWLDGFARRLREAISLGGRQLHRRDRPVGPSVAVPAPGGGAARARARPGSAR